MPCQSHLPIIVLPGFLDAGRITLLNHILHRREGRRVAVIVNDISEVNIDVALGRGGGAELSRTDLAGASEAAAPIRRRIDRRIPRDKRTWT